MEIVKFVYWQENDAWLGYLEAYPDSWTQGTTVEDLKEHLKDLYRDLVKMLSNPESGARTEAAE